MNLELDHVFILVEPEAKVAEQLIEQGFQEGPRNTHPGQGTANRRVYFTNGMLEFLWLRDADEAKNGPGRDLRFPERDADPGVLERVSQAARFSIRLSSEHLMEITLDHHALGRTEDFRPAMPLILYW